MKKLTLLILSFLHFSSLLFCQENNFTFFGADDVDLFADLDPYALNEKALVSNSEMPLLQEPANPITLAPIVAIIDLQNETQNTERFQCKHCTRSYEEKKNLRKHIKNKHSNAIDHDQKWPCNQCDTKHRTIYDLKSHQRTVHQKVFRFRCPHYKTCKYICAHRGDLNKHASRGPRDIYDKHIGKPDWKNIENEEGWS